MSIIVDIQNDCVEYPSDYIKPVFPHTNLKHDNKLTDIQKMYRKSNLKMIQNIRKRKLEKITEKKYIACECGSVVSSTYYHKHIYTNRHQRYIKCIY
jgi:hypothetical protein